MLIAKGFCMGSADVVPGVSGGTMAFILGIYRQLIEAITSFDLIWVKSIFTLDIRTALTRPDFAFLLPLATGIFLALMFFTRIISLPELIRTEPELIYSLFFGLISGSILVLLGQARRFRLGGAVALLAGLAFGFIIVTLTPAATPDAGWFIFICGALAAAAMLLPGLSGSFVLLILGKYAHIFDAIGYFKFAVIVPFALGVAAGLILFSRILSWLLHRYYQRTILFILGVLAASLWSIWPFQHRRFGVIRQKEHIIGADPYLPMTLSYDVLILIGMIITGFSIVLILNRGRPGTG